MRYLYAGILLLSASGCGAPCFVVAATRCNENLVEVCGSDKRWRTAVDCDRLPRAPGPMRCQQKDGTCTCLPASRR
jgi:hypothetical protein